MNSAPRTCTNSFSSSFPAAPQERGTGTFLIFLCFCIAKSPSIWVFPVNKTAPTLVCRSSFFHVVKMAVPNRRTACFHSKRPPRAVKSKAVFRAIRNVFSAKQLPEGIFWLRSFSRQMGIFQLARKVSAMVGSRAPKPSAASAGYRHETAWESAPPAVTKKERYSPFSFVPVSGSSGLPPIRSSNS